MEKQQACAAADFCAARMLYQCLACAVVIATALAGQDPTGAFSRMRYGIIAPAKHSPIVNTHRKNADATSRNVGVSH
jgi:hypothetical protein